MNKQVHTFNKIEPISAANRPSGAETNFASILASCDPPGIMKPLGWIDGLMDDKIMPSADWGETFVDVNANGTMSNSSLRRSDPSDLSGLYVADLDPAYGAFVNSQDENTREILGKVRFNGYGVKGEEAIRISEKEMETRIAEHERLDQILEQAEEMQENQDSITRPDLRRKSKKTQTSLTFAVIKVTMTLYRDLSITIVIEANGVGTCPKRSGKLTLEFKPGGSTSVTGQVTIEASLEGCLRSIPKKFQDPVRKVSKFLKAKASATLRGYNRYQSFFEYFTLALVSIITTLAI